MSISPVPAIDLDPEKVLSNTNKRIEVPSGKHAIAWAVVGLTLWVLVVIVFPTVIRKPCPDGWLCLGVSASEESIRQAMLWSLGGIIATVSLWFTYQKNRLEQDADWTRRYAEAVAQIGDKNESVRIGGLYALGRIAEDAPRDRSMIMRVLASFIRNPPSETAPASPSEEIKPISPAVAAAVEVLSELSKLESPPQGLNLRKANLRDADMTGANLTGVNLTDATLRNARLSGAVLKDATLRRANLEHTMLKGADMRGANMQGSDLSHAILYKARLEGARFFRGNVNQASARGWTAKSLESAASWDEKTVWPQGHSPGEILKEFVDQTA